MLLSKLKFAFLGFVDNVRCSRPGPALWHKFPFLNRRMTTGSRVSNASWTGSWKPSEGQACMHRRWLLIVVIPGQSRPRWLQRSQPPPVWRVVSPGLRRSPSRHSRRRTLLNNPRWPPWRRDRSRQQRRRQDPSPDPIPWPDASTCSNSGWPTWSGDWPTSSGGSAEQARTLGLPELSRTALPPAQSLTPADVRSARMSPSHRRERILGVLPESRCPSCPAGRSCAARPSSRGSAGAGYGARGGTRLPRRGQPRRPNRRRAQLPKAQLIRLPRPADRRSGRAGPQRAGRPRGFSSLDSTS